MNIFLSYNWNNKKEADLIERNLSALGIEIKRDINTIKYKDNLRDFMSQITNSDYAIILISNDYLKSPNCLYELFELSKDEQYEKKFLPVIIDGTNIYGITEKTELIAFWEKRCKEVEENIRTVSPTNAINLIKELKLYKEILNSLDDFIQNITERLNHNFEELTKNNFQDLLKFIGYDGKAIQQDLLKIKNISNPQIKELELEKLSKKYPNNKDVLFTIGYINLTELKNYHKAKHSFERYIKDFDEDAYLVYNNLGLACYNLGERGIAKKHYLKGLEINKYAYQILHNLGNLEAIVGDYDLAKSYYLQTIKIFPKDAETFYNLAKVFMDSDKDYETAAHYYSKAIEIEPDFFMAYNNLAEIYVRTNNFDEAIKLLEIGLEQNPDDYVTLYNLGMLYYTRKENYQIARKYFRKAIRLNHKYIPAKIGLAKLMILHFKDLDEAKEILMDAYEIDNTNKEVLDHLKIVNGLQKTSD